MTKKQLQQWATENGFSYSYSGNSKTLYLHNFNPGVTLEVPADTKGVSIVGLQHHKLI